MAGLTSITVPAARMSTAIVNNKGVDDSPIVVTIAATVSGIRSYAKRADHSGDAKLLSYQCLLGSHRAKDDFDDRRF